MCRKHFRTFFYLGFILIRNQFQGLSIDYIYLHNQSIYCEIVLYWKILKATLKQVWYISNIMYIMFLSSICHIEKYRSNYLMVLTMPLLEYITSYLMQSHKLFGSLFLTVNISILIMSSLHSAYQITCWLIIWCLMVRIWRFINTLVLAL